MTPGTLVLLHSPLTTASAWGSLPERLDGYDVVVVGVTDDDRPPYASRYVARAALELAAAAVRPPLVLIGHGAAGPLLPSVGAAQRAAHRLVGGYVFVDAELPGPARSTWLDRLRAVDPDAAERVEAGGTAPGGPAPDGVRLRRRGKDFFAEELPMSQDWPDAPCGYLLTSRPYREQARLAGLRGWPVVEHDAGHFAAVSDPSGTTAALRRLISAL